MAWPYIISASLGLGWALSPDVLVRLGNGVAENRTLYLAALGLTTLISALAITLIRHPGLRTQGRCSPTSLLVQGIGHLPAMTVILASRLGLVLLLPTGLLVSAGFAFNEIFVYWFPNFGFSFIVLGIITLLHLAGERFALAAQPIFIGIVLICMIFLCLAGLGGSASGSPVSVDAGFSLDTSVLAGSFLLFLGYDYTTPESSTDSRLPSFAGLFFCLILFILWAMLSLQYVGVDRLSATTMPHTMAAREILGQPGRLLMGVVIISGVCGAVNALFHLASGALAGLAEQHLLPGHGGEQFNRRFFILLCSVAIGIFMMTGLAGEDILEVYIQAALLLWLIHVGLQCLAAGRILLNHGNHQAYSGFVLGIFFSLCALYLAYADEHTATVLRLIGVALLSAATISAFWLWKKPAVEIISRNPE